MASQCRTTPWRRFHVPRVRYAPYLSKPRNGRCTFTRVVDASFHLAAVGRRWADHVSRYESVARTLNEGGYTVYGLDAQGHGLSEGDRSYFERFNHLVQDAEAFVKDRIERDSLPASLPKFLFGHSMGSSMSLFLSQRNPDLFAGAALSAPLLTVHPNSVPMWLQDIAIALGENLPHLRLPGIPSEAVAMDPVVIASHARDPLVHGSTSWGRIGSELLPLNEKLEPLKHTFRTPLLVFHSVNDQLTPFPPVEKFMADVSSPDKTFVPLEGVGHEVFFDKGAADRLAKVVEWMHQRSSV